MPATILDAPETIHNNLSKADLYFAGVGPTGVSGVFRDDRADYILNSSLSHPERLINNPRVFYQLSNSDKKFIELEDSFNKQLDNIKEFWNDVNLNNAKRQFAKSSSELLQLRPLAFSMELTSEKSVFYVFSKKNYLFFIQHFLDIEDPADDEMIITIYKDNAKLPSYAGSLSLSIGHIKSLIRYSSSSSSN